MTTFEIVLLVILLFGFGQIGWWLNRIDTPLRAIYRMIAEYRLHEWR